MRLQPSLWALLIVLTTTFPTSAQYSSRIYTRPTEPTVESLDRLNLRIAWRAALPSESVRDGIALVQWLDDQIFVQMKSGQLVVLDAKTGGYLWQSKPTQPYGNVYSVAVNPKYVYFVNGTRLHSYDRRKGVEDFVFDMGTTVSAGPVADNDAVYVELGTNRIVKYGLPFPVRTLRPKLDPKTVNTANQQREDAPTGADGKFYQGRRTSQSNVDDIRAMRASVQLNVQGTEAESRANRTPSISILPTLRPPYRLDNGGKTESISILQTLTPPYRLPDGSNSPSIAILPSLTNLEKLKELSPHALEPVVKFDHQVNLRMPFPPLLTTDRLFAPTTRSLAFAISIEEAQPIYDFATEAAISAPLGQYLDTAYIPCENAQLYAVNILTGRVEWRYTGGGPLNHMPVVTDNQVFVSGFQSGVSSVTRLNGQFNWTHGKSDRVHAVNSKFVYTSDRLGNLYVLDRMRGLELTKLNLSEFNVPILNDSTDRLLIAANNGTLICLHDKDFIDPILLRNPSKDEVKKEEPMMAVPKKDPIPAPKKDQN